MKPLIEHDESDVGGSVNIECDDGYCSTSYALSNKESPLSVRCKVSDYSSPKMASLVVESIVKKHDPLVLHLIGVSESSIETIGSLKKVWCGNNSSVFVSDMSEAQVIRSLCSISSIMQNSDIILDDCNGLKVRRKKSVVSETRKIASPMAFLSIMEEYDYRMPKSSSSCAFGILDAIKRNASLLGDSASPFLDSAESINIRKRGDAVRFGMVDPMIVETVVDVLVPSLVKYGCEHDLTQELLAEFAIGTKKYAETCSEFLSMVAEERGADVDSKSDTY